MHPKFSPVGAWTHDQGHIQKLWLGGGPGVEVEVNLVSAEGASCYRPRRVCRHAPPGKFLKYLSQTVHYKSILKVIWEQKLLKNLLKKDLKKKN